MLKWFLTMSMVILSCSIAFPQTILKGTIREAGTGSVVPNAIVTVTEAPLESIVTYTVSDDEGKFSISLGNEKKEYSVNVSLLGFESVSVSLERFKEETQTIILSRSSIDLKEVTVLAPSIRKWGDTIDYRVDAFAEQKDRTIADVLKKLPGIEVQSDGRILYEGKPIQKFYIEGMDLLEGKYNLASNNLPSNAVSSVQILENHQPVRVLDSLVSSQRASLNIKLKKGVAVTGSGKAGVGASPLLRDANLTPMLFTKKQQMIFSYQTNNTGEDVAKEIKVLTLEELLEKAESNIQKQELLAIQAMSPPSFSTNRYLFNNSHLLNANYLLSLKQETQLRVNLSYLNDYQRQEGQTQTIYYFPADTVELTEVKRNKLYFSSARAELSLLRNAKMNYLKNDFLFSGYWDSHRGDIQKAEGLLTQDLVNPYHSLSNTFKAILPIGRQLVTFSSILSLNEAPQNLRIAPGLFEELTNDRQPYEALEQQVRLTSFYAHNFASLTKGIKEWTLISTLGMQVERQRLASALTKSLSDVSVPLEGAFLNDLRWRQEKYYGQAEGLYKTENWNISLKVPVSLWYFNVKDQPLQQKQSLSKPTAEPNVSLKYTFSPFWYATAGYNLRYRFGEVSQLNYGYLLKNYRTLQRNFGPIAQTQSQMYSAGLFYKNPVRALFSSLRYSYTVLDYNQTYQNSLQQDGSLVITAVPLGSHSSSQSLTLQANKYLPPVRTMADISSNLSSNRRQQILNGVLTSVRNEQLSFRVNVNSRLLDWLIFDYKTTFSVSQITIAETEPEKLLSHEHLASINLYPTDNHYVGLQADAYYNTFAGNRNSFFGDIVYRYSLFQHKLDFELKWTNVLSTTHYTRALVSSYALVEDRYMLRPSQFLMSLRFSL